MEQDDIMSKINSAKEQFYSDHQKNTFFKKQQKFDCATTVMSGLNENEVFANVFAVKDDIIFFNYTMFKTVAHPEYYQKMADYLFMISSNLIDTYGSYRIFVNCNGMTISAVERYKEFVSVVSKRGLTNNKGLLAKLSIIHICNPPSFIDNGLKILIPLVDNNLWTKISIVQDASK
jgi:hypothetical protein